jgi:hypothetical protein
MLQFDCSIADDGEFDIQPTFQTGFVNPQMARMWSQQSISEMRKPLLNQALISTDGIQKSK